MQQSTPRSVTGWPLLQLHRMVLPTDLQPLQQKVAQEQTLLCRQLLSHSQPAQAQQTSSQQTAAGWSFRVACLDLFMLCLSSNSTFVDERMEKLFLATRTSAGHHRRPARLQPRQCRQRQCSCYRKAPSGGRWRRPLPPPSCRAAQNWKPAWRRCDSFAACTWPDRRQPAGRFVQLQS